MAWKDNVVDVPDFPAEGIIFKDITPVLEDGKLFSEVIRELVDLCNRYTFNKIICADARGFIFGSAVAAILGVGLVLARKPGKLPRPGYKVCYDLEYGSNSLVISAGSINDMERVLIIDDLLATGGTANSMAQLVLKSGGVIAGALFPIELRELSKAYRDGANYPVESLLKYGCSVEDKIVIDTRSVVDEDQLRYCGQYLAEVISVTEDKVKVSWDMDDREFLEVSKDSILYLNINNVIYKYRR